MRLYIPPSQWYTDFYVRGSSGHVDDTRPSEINHTGATERFSSESAEETIGAPDGSDNDRVDLRFWPKIKGK